MVTPRPTTRQTLVCSSRTGVCSASVPPATALLESPSRNGMMERSSSKKSLDDMMIWMTTYLPKAPMCTPMSLPAGTARTTTATTSGLPATATVLAVWTTLTPRTSRVSFQRFGYNCDSNADHFTDYKSAVQWIQKQIDSNESYKTDDTRFWVSVVAI